MLAKKAFVAKYFCLYRLMNDIHLPKASSNPSFHKGLIAESLEFSSRPVLGVQFHPENDFGFERNRILGWLLKKAFEESFEHLTP